MAIHLNNASRKGIKHYQQARGLDVTGRADAATRASVKVHNRNARIKVRKIKKKAANVTPPDPYAAQVAAAQRLKYDPQRQEIAGQIRASRQQGRNVATWFDDYLEANRRAEARAKETAQQTAASIGQIADRSGATDRTNRQEMIAALRADAQTRGATVDPSLDATGVQAEASRRVGLDESAAGSLRTGQNQANYLGNEGRIGAGRKVQALTGEANRRANLRRTRADLRREEADYGQQVRQGLETTAFNQQVAQAGLGIRLKQTSISAKNAATSQALAGSLIQDRRTDNRRQSAQARETARYHRETADLRARGLSNAEAKDAYQRNHGLGPYKPASKGKKAKLTPNQVQTRIDGVNEARQWIKNLSSSRHFTSSQIRAALRTGKDITDEHGNKRKVPKIGNDLINAAYDLETYGYLSPTNLRRLKARGVRIPPEWKRRKYKPSGTRNLPARAG